LLIGIYSQPMLRPGRLSHPILFAHPPPNPQAMTLEFGVVIIGRVH
jgi:hypothetical protein